MLRIALLFAILASPAAAVTFTPEIELVRTGACGSGGAVVGDGCSPVRVDGQPALAAFGQELAGGWNSQDTDAATLWIGGLSGAQTLTLSFMDLHDLARSFARVEVGGAAWIFGRGGNGEVREITLGLAGEDELFALIFTRLNDGYSVGASACRPRAL